jgi:AcrR family transcriptional regulator
MDLKFHDLAVVNERHRSDALRRSARPVGTIPPTARSETHGPLDARETDRSQGALSAKSSSLGKPKAAKIPPRSRILSAASELFLRYGIADVSVAAIARAAGTNKPTLYNHFVSKDQLVAEYLRESANQVDSSWARLDTAGSDALDQLRTWLAEMADGLVSGWARRLANAAVELKQRSHPARRVLKAHDALQRRRLTRLCRAAGLRCPSLLADALLLLFNGACVMAPNGGRVALSSRFVLLGEAMIAAHTKAPLGARQEQHP